MSQSLHFLRPAKKAFFTKGHFHIFVLQVDVEPALLEEQLRTVFPYIQSNTVFQHHCQHPCRNPSCEDVLLHLIDRKKKTGKCEELVLCKTKRIGLQKKSQTVK